MTSDANLRATDRARADLAERLQYEAPAPREPLAELHPVFADLLACLEDAPAVIRRATVEPQQ